MPWHLLHLTDPHIPPPGETLQGGHDPTPGLEAAIADLATRHAADGPAPAVCALLTGDLVRDGEPAAYRRLAGLLRGLPCPVHMLLGNHDDRAAFRAAFPGAAVDAEGFVQAAVPVPAATLLLLDTHEPGQPHGVLCAARLRWLAARLAATEGPVLLALHHPPLAVGIEGMDAIALREPERLWAVLAPHRARIRHLFHGHLHRPIAGSWNGIPFSAPRGTAFAVPLDFGTAKLAPERAPPSYAVARIDDAEVVVHQRELR